MIDLAKYKALPPVVQQAAQQKILQELYIGSLFCTAKHLLGFQQLTVNTHRTMIQALESPRKRKLIIMPRGSFKSSVSSIAYPIWLLLRDPNTRILLDSELYSNSKNFLREIKGHLQSERLTSLFGSFETRTWNEGEIIIRQRTRVIKEASITASGIGAEKTGQHYDYIICDDLNSPTNSSTPEGRQRVIQHYRYNTSILEPEGTMAIIGTRYCELDVPGYILHNEVIKNAAQQRDQ